MSRYMLMVVVSIAAALAICSAPSRSEEPRSVTLIGDPWPPYVLGELGYEATGGTGVELMRAIFDRIDGVELSIPLVPWKRALQEVERGRMDGVGILLKTPEREQYMDYTDELFRSSTKIWYLATAFPDGFDWQRIEDLRGYSVGGVGGHSYGPEADAAITADFLKVVLVPSSDQLFLMLSKGRIDLAIANGAVGTSWVFENTKTGEEIVAADRILSEEVFYIAFSKMTDARELIPLVNQRISQLREEGLIDRILGDSE